MDTKEAIEIIIRTEKILRRELDYNNLSIFKKACNTLYPVALKNKSIEVSKIYKREFYFCPQCGVLQPMGYGSYCSHCGQLVSFEELKSRVGNQQKENK